MHLLPLWMKEDGEPAWQIYSLANSDASCPITAAFEAIRHNGNSNRHIDGMLALIRTISRDEHGPKLYIGNPNVCHEAVSGEGIFAFRKGSLRLYWFYGESRKIVICPHLSTKNVSKTPKPLAATLIQLRDEYLQACASSNITVGEN